MKDRTLHLKIKIKSLVAEAKIIKQEAKKVTEETKWGLLHHNVTVVRPVTRRNLLAYAMIRNHPYSKTESKVSPEKCLGLTDFNNILVLAKRFGATDKEQMQQWMVEAVNHLRSQGYIVQCPNILEKKEEKPKKVSLTERVSVALGL